MSKDSSVRSGGVDLDLHAQCTEALLRHRGCNVPENRDWASVQFGEIAAADVHAILAALHEGTPNVQG